MAKAASKRSKPAAVRDSPQPRTRSVTAQLQTELAGTILRFGALAAALTTIVVTMSYVLPSFFRLYSSDPAPFEGKAEHATDMSIKLALITMSIQNAAEAAQKAAAAAESATVSARLASLKEDQRDLCGLVERLANINMRLQQTPTDNFFLMAKADRVREIDVMRSRIQMSGQVPEC